VWILHKEFAGEATLSIVSDGKHHFFTINRRQLFGLMSQGHEALRDMEPASPTRP